MDLGHQHSHDCKRTMDPDMAFSGSLGQDVTKASGSSTGHSVQFGPIVSARLPDIYMVSGSSPTHCHLDGLWWQHGPQTSAQTLATTAQAQTSSWPQMVAQALHVYLSLTAVSSPVLPLSTVREPISFAFSPISPSRPPSFPSLSYLLTVVALAAGSRWVLGCLSSSHRRPQDWGS